MRRKLIKNVAASVHDRLLSMAHERGEDFQLLLTRYGLERWMYRLSKSPYRDQFILKGGMLFAIWEKESYRPTRDIDFLSFGENEAGSLVTIFQEVCRIKVGDDGIIFIPESVRDEPIRDEMDYGGIRIRLEGRLGRIRIPVQADIGFGDAVNPSPRRITYPTLLGGPPPRLRAYPKESIVAEKFQAMVQFGMANSRMKDFYDLWIFARRFEFDGRQLAGAIKATIERRSTPIPIAVPMSFTEEFCEDPQKSAQWTAFLERGRLTSGGESLVDVCKFLLDFLWPLLDHLAHGNDFQFVWPPGGPWNLGR